MNLQGVFLLLSSTVKIITHDLTLNPICHKTPVKNVAFFIENMRFPLFFSFFFNLRFHVPTPLELSTLKLCTQFLLICSHEEVTLPISTHPVRSPLTVLKYIKLHSNP